MPSFVQIAICVHYTIQQYVHLNLNLNFCLVVLVSVESRMYLFTEALSVGETSKQEHSLATELDVFPCLSSYNSYLLLLSFQSLFITLFNTSNKIPPVLEHFWCLFVLLSRVTIWGWEQVSNNCKSFPIQEFNSNSMNKWVSKWTNKSHEEIEIHLYFYNENWSLTSNFI